APFPTREGGKLPVFLPPLREGPGEGFLCKGKEFEKHARNPPMRRSLLFTLALFGFFCTLVLAFADKEKVDPAHEGGRLLPGVQSDGTVQLHNQWRLRPAGKHLTVGDFPVNIALHPSGKWLAILHAGYGDHEVAIVDIAAKKQRIVSRATIDEAFYGL